MVEHQQRVGARIRKARKAKDWSQAELARAMTGKTDGPSVSRWERGEVLPRPATLDELARVLDVDPSYFFSPEPESATDADVIGALRTTPDAVLASRVEEIADAVRNLLEAQQVIAETVRARSRASS